MAKLLVQESTGAREFELVDLEVNIGRELDNTLRLADPSISRHHAVIRQGPSGYLIQDLGSSNGVLLNGNKVESGPLLDGDRITLGQMQLTFLDPPPARGTETSPLGTVRMGTEAMDRLRAVTSLEPAPAPPAAAPVPPAAAPPLPAAAPAEPFAAAPAPDEPFAGAPFLAFLLPYLPNVPDDALPVRLADGSIERGDFFTRLLANLIDYLPALALGLVALVLGQVMLLGCIMGLLQLALGIAYLILIPLCWMRFGASPGKKLMKLRVVPELDPEGRIDLSEAILRLLGYLVCGIISGIIMLPVSLTLVGLAGPALGLHVFGILAMRVVSLAVGVVPYLMILGAQRKGLEDIFSKSIVIKVDR